MSASKDIFLKDKELVKWWVSVTHNDRFEAILTFARAEIMENRPTQDQMIGSELLIHTLSTLAETEAASFDFPNPGLHHMADSNRPRQEEKTVKPKKKE